MFLDRNWSVMGLIRMTLKPSLEQVYILEVSVDMAGCFCFGWELTVSVADIPTTCTGWLKQRSLVAISSRR